MASTATINTQALTENCSVCRSQCIEVLFEPAAADAPELIEAEPALRGRTPLFTADDEVEDEAEDFADCDGLFDGMDSTTRS